jgi:hypothetical protein
LGTTIVGMADAAIYAVMRTSPFNAGFCVQGAGRNSLAACATNEKALGQIGDARFTTARVPQRRRTETHQSDHNQHHHEHKDRPRHS